MPEPRMTMQVWSFGNFLSINHKIRHAAKLATGYKGRVPRAIEPPALP